MRYKSRTCSECWNTIHLPTDHHGMCPDRPDRPEQFETDAEWQAALDEERDAYLEGKAEDARQRKLDERIGLCTCGRGYDPDCPADAHHGTANADFRDAAK